MSEEFDLNNNAGRKFAQKGVMTLFALMLCVYLLFQVIDSNEADTSIVLQTITGDIRVITEAGPYLRFFGTPHYYKKVVAVNFTGDSKAAAASRIDKIKVRFLDTSMGEAGGVARFRLPASAQPLTNIHREFGSMDGLISNLLERVVVESVKASARTMSVEEHYSGGAGQMSLDFDDQLRQGIYVTNQIIEGLNNPITPVAGDGNAEPAPDLLRQRQRVLVVKKKDDEGNYLRTNNPLSEYAMVVVSASIEEVDYEPRVDQRLAAQKQAAADEALARQNLKKAQQEAKTAKALGEKAIAEARAFAEKEKLQAEIEAQKEASVARINAEREVEVARQDSLKQSEILELQRMEAQGLEVMANARKKAAENALDPQKVFDAKLSAWKAVEVAKYQHMSKAQLVPQVQMGGSNGQSGDSAMTLLQLMGVKAAKDLGMEFQQIGSASK